MTWTQEAVLALAPDPESMRAGKGLASKSKWGTLGCSDAAVWGECQGSGSKPYQTRIDLSGPAFKCSCPSRKFPCKHSLALFILFADQRGLFADGEPPGWVSEWLESRQERAQKQTEKAEKPLSEKPVDPAAQAARQAGRLSKTAAGLDDLELWLHDLVRHGLAAAQSKPYAFWDKPAARLTDAQAPGLARMVRDLAALSSSGAGWPDRLLARLGKIQLLIDAFRRREVLPEEVQADILSLIGVTTSREDVLREPLIRDRWRAVGTLNEEDSDGMSVRRLWLQGAETGRMAMLLSFTHRSQRTESVPEAVVGTEMTADLAYYPGAAPMRALVAERRSGSDPLAEWKGAGSVEEALLSWRAALARKPWTEEWPLMLQSATPYRRGDGWLIRDGANRVLPIASSFKRPWDLLASSGGGPVGLFGVWDGAALLPLSAWADGRWIDLSPARESL